MPRVNSFVDTPEGPGKVRQVHVLANRITVMVEGPNETRTWVQMDVVRTRVCAHPRKRRGPPRRCAAVEADEANSPDDVDASGDDVPSKAGRGQQQIPDEAGGGARPGRSRRRKR